MSMIDDHSHSHSHDEGVGPFSGPPRTMFYLGLFIGVAACTTIALVFFLWLSLGGKSLSLGSGDASDTNKPVAQQPADDNTQPTEKFPVVSVKPVQANEHIRGTASAKVTLVEYSDFQCPFCSRVEPTLQQVEKQYGSDVRIVYRHFPLSIHPNAQKAAEASECAAKLGGEAAFWKMHDLMFAAQDSLDSEGLLGMAKKIGLNGPSFTACLNSGEMAQKVKDMQDGADAKINGTPATIVVKGNGTSGVLISGAYPFATFKQYIDQAK